MRPTSREDARRPPGRGRRTGEWALALTVSMACVWVAFRHVAFAEVRAHLTHLRWGWAATYAAALAAVQICRARRWLALAAPFSGIDGAAAWRTANVGTVFTMLLPLRLGELVRPAMMQREHGVPFAATLGAVAVERVLDGLVVTLSFFVAGAWVPWPEGMPTSLQLAARAAAAVFVLAGLLLGGAYRARRGVTAVLARWAAGSPLLSRLAALWEAWVAGVGALPGPAAMAAVVAWTAAYWVVNALGLWALMAGFGWQRAFADAVLSVSVLCIGIMLPAGPGFLGTYQAALVLVLTALGVGRAEALAYALTAYALNLGVVVSFGLPHLWPPRRQPTAARRG